MARRTRANGPWRGRGVDAGGGPVIDPTANVLLLVEAANKRQDDLRLEAGRRIDTELACVKEISLIQAKHVKDIGDLRAEYTNKLAEAEAKRIDAIRAVDVNAVAVASERQQASATVLANQVAQSAEALRTLVSTTAAAYAEQQTKQMSQITDRLALVERAQYEGRGKGAGMDKLVGYGLALAGVAVAVAVYLK